MNETSLQNQTEILTIKLFQCEIFARIRVFAWQNSSKLTYRHLDTVWSICVSQYFGRDCNLTSLNSR